MLIKTLRKFETLRLSTAKGVIEIVLVKKANKDTFHIYAPKSVLIDSHNERVEQYEELAADSLIDKDAETKAIKYFAKGLGGA